MAASRFEGVIDMYAASHRLGRLIPPRREVDEPATIIILPVVRIEHGPDLPADEPKGRRRRRPSRT